MTQAIWPRWLTPLFEGTGTRRPPASRGPRGWHPSLEPLEDRTLPSVVLAATNNHGNGYAALDYQQSGGYVPPDTNGAAGPTSAGTGLGAYVETVNQTIALYPDKAAGSTAAATAAPQTASLDTFWFTTGKLAGADSGSSLSDPIVTYDDQIGRFVVGDQDVDFNTHVSRFDLAVSRSSDPASLGTADWNFYQINTTQAGFDADYPGNFGYNHDALVFTLNMFSATQSSTDHTLVVSVSNADLAGGAAPSALRVYRNNINDFSLRPTVMHDSAAGDPMWLVTEHGDGTSIDVIKETNVLSTAAGFAYTNLAVTPYAAVVNPLNPNGTLVTNNVDSRILKAAEWNNTIVASHSVSVRATEDDAQWYAIDVASGTPALKDQGRVSAGNNTYIVYPSIDINASGQVGMTYMKSGTDSSSDYLSMYVTGRNAADARGTMETPVLVPAGHGQANYQDFARGGRAGDLSGINVDPSDGSFWAANEFATAGGSANWGTAVADFTIGNPLPPADLAVTATGPSSVDVTNGSATATYTITVTNNGPSAAQGVVLSDLLPAGSSFVSMKQTSGTDAFTLTSSGGSVGETAAAAIASGSSDVFSLVVSAPGNLSNGAAFNDAASVSANNPDPSTANNSVAVTGKVVNNTTGADLSVSVSGPASAPEGAAVTYTITVNNAGPTSATGVTLADTLGPLLNYQSAATPAGTTFKVQGSAVTFTLGTIAAGGKVTVSVTAQATEDGSTSDTATVASSSPDPGPTNNKGSATTALTEPAIGVSAPLVLWWNRTFSGQVATFTHANGVEPGTAFAATIDWGDGKTSAGTVTRLSNGSYSVTGSHAYASALKRRVTTSVTEVGTALAKVDDDPASLPPGERDVVRFLPTSPPGNPGPGGTWPGQPAAPDSRAAPSGAWAPALPAGDPLFDAYHLALYHAAAAASHADPALDSAINALVAALG